MRGIVIYYSQTSNTKKIATAIHAGVKRIIEDSRLSAIKNIDPHELAKYDLIGIGSPWWGKIPPNVVNFIEAFKPRGEKYVFPFFTHGSLPAGCMHNTIPFLKQRGLTIVGYRDWYANSLQQFIPYPHLTSGHPDETDLMDAEEFGKEMAQLSQRIYNGERHLIPEPPTEMELDEIYGKPVPPPGEMLEAEDLLLEQRKINMEKCTCCSLCVENCPTDSIDFSVSPPVFKDDTCAHCWFCEQICPEGAIEMDWESFTELHDGHLDPLIEGLEKAEAKGRFRRLVSLEDVGRNEYWYKISEHPRYVIE